MQQTTNTSHKFGRLLILPIAQLLICGIILFVANMVEEILLSKSPFLEETIGKNLGIFSGIASEIFNDYRSDKLSPYIVEINKLHNWVLYLFYGLIASFVLQIYALKSKICPKEIIICFCLLISIALLYLNYRVLYASNSGTEVLISTETLGLFGANKGKARLSAIESMAIYLLVLFFLHYYHNRWISQYYCEPFKMESDKSRTVVTKNVENADNDKFENLRKLKELLDSGMLTQEEFDAQKKQILNT